MGISDCVGNDGAVPTQFDVLIGRTGFQQEATTVKGHKQLAAKYPCMLTLATVTATRVLLLLRDEQGETEL